jgi:glucan-binding YG repeat protein
MVKGLKTLGSNKYFFDGSGVMLSGWQQSGSKWYYFKRNSTGSRAPAYVNTAKKIGGAYYAFDADGVMLKSGVKKAGGNSYYLKSTGKAFTKKWYKKSGKWYYFGADAKMVKNTSLKIGKKTYKFDKSGVCKNP